MNRLDEELAQAAEQGEAEGEAPSAPEPAFAQSLGATPPAASVPSHGKRNLGLLAALLVMGGGILTLVFTSFEDAAIYSKGVDELVSQREKLAKRNVRVEGMLVKGSLLRRDQPCEYRFRMVKNGTELAVRYPQCIVPDTFKDMPGMNVAVTAEGKLSESGDFEASHIMAKCPSKYEMKELAAQGKAAPHAAGPAALPAENKN
jgi:cytochrome c-type biogenesis protein CcmE